MSDSDTERCQIRKYFDNFVWRDAPVERNHQEFLLSVISERKMGNM